MSDIREAVEEIKETLVEIKKDLSYHIKRTDQLEDMLMPLHKMRVTGKGILWVIITSGAIVAAIETIKDFI